MLTLVYKLIKTFLTYIGSLILLVILLPLFVLISVIIIIDSGRPIFFLQDRRGKDGIIFQMIKFRTMIVNAERIGSGHYSFKDDPRITKTGKWLRKTSLDELPQLINILMGDMAFIGPRPVLVNHPYSINEYPDHYRARFDIKPGVTGWAQVNGRKTLAWDERLELDVEYVSKESFFFDIKIILKTISTIFNTTDNVNTILTTNPDKSLEFILITNDPKLAHIADQAGVRFIMIDLEVLGKESRQTGLDTVKSNHSIKDIVLIKDALINAELVVRINTFNKDSKQEIDSVIRSGADILMLPYFEDVESVEQVIDMASPIKVIPLIETVKALALSDKLKELKIEQVHYGLNDLHIQMGFDNMFEVLFDQEFSNSITSFNSSSITLGIGGISCIGKGEILPEEILAAHVKYHSNTLILSRSFIKCLGNDLYDVSKFKTELAKLHNTYNKYLNDSNLTNQMFSRLRERLERH